MSLCYYCFRVSPVLHDYVEANSRSHTCTMNNSYLTQSLMLHNRTLQLKLRTQRAATYSVATELTPQCSEGWDEIISMALQLSVRVAAFTFSYLQSTKMQNFDPKFPKHYWECCAQTPMATPPALCPIPVHAC